MESFKVDQKAFEAPVAAVKLKSCWLRVIALVWSGQLQPSNVLSHHLTRCSAACDPLKASRLL
jgi:hypothetical protein